MPRSKIFSLPKFRSRSKSLPRKSVPESAPSRSVSTDPIKRSRPRPTPRNNNHKGGNFKHGVTNGSSNSGNRRKNIVAPVRSRNGASHHSENTAHLLQQEDSDSEKFVTALDRSPPSFCDELLDSDGGIFPTLVNVNYNTAKLKDELDDPPILMLEEDDQNDEAANGWFPEFGTTSIEIQNRTVPPHRRNPSPSQVRSKLRAQDAQPALVDAPRNKNPRTVSPSPSPLTAEATNSGDDLRAWGISPAPKSVEHQNVEELFGTNFFSSFTKDPVEKASSVFDFDDFYGGSDGFFGASWAEPNQANNGRNTPPKDTTNPSEEKKTEPPAKAANVLDATPPDPMEVSHSSPGVASSESWSSPARKTETDLLVVNPSPTAPASLQTSTDAVTAKKQSDPSPEKKGIEPESWDESNHPLKRETKGDKVVVCLGDFVDANNELRLPRSGKDNHDARVDHDKKATHGARRHRRVASGGSSGSRHRRVGPGSVGSNSSAVDQVLERYRQKRLAKRGESSASVQSSQHLSQAMLANHHNNHRRSPSDQSLSKIIDTLETATSGHLHSSSRQAGLHPSPTSSSTGFSRGGSGYHPNLNAAVNEIADRLRIHRAEESTGDNDQFLLANIEATIGPRGVAPDMESLSGRSHRRSRAPHHHHRISTDSSVDSRTSRQSFRSYRSNRSALTHISKESQSVANDLFRLEAQLAMVAKQQQQPAEAEPPTKRPENANDTSPRSNGTGPPLPRPPPSSLIGAEPIARPTPLQIVAPPGKLGILLANKSGRSGPTHVSAVRSESVLAGKVHVGDRFVSIDGEDVTNMNSKEITTIMARKSDFERVIVLIPSIATGRQWI